MQVVDQAEHEKQRADRQEPFQRRIQQQARFAGDDAIRTAAQRTMPTPAAMAASASAVSWVAMGNCRRRASSR